MRNYVNGGKRTGNGFVCFLFGNEFLEYLRFASLKSELSYFMVDNVDVIILLVFIYTPFMNWCMWNETRVQNVKYDVHGA